MSEYIWVVFRYTLGGAAIRDLLFATCGPSNGKQWITQALENIHKSTLGNSENITVDVTWKKRRWIWIPIAHVEWDYQGVHHEQSYEGWYGIERLAIWELYMVKNDVVVERPEEGR